VIVATAGHIDHGKTTLVRALTGIDTDRLPEEKARGISIDVGFAHCVLPDGRTVGFVDVPGHERFVRNMLSGVYAVGHVLLLIAADDGVMPQTREHLHIVSLLGVQGGTVVITKKDRVDEARLREVEVQARELLRSSGLGDLPVLAVSATTGEGMNALRARLAAVAAVERRGQEGAGMHARFVVDQVFTATGSGTICRGTVISGSIAAGDTLVISPVGTQARVRKLQRHGRTADRAYAGDRCALNLANVEQQDVARGDWLVAAPAHRPTERIDGWLQVLDSEPAPVKHWQPVHVHIGAADVPARVALRRGESIAPGERAYAQLRLERPVHAAHGDRFILRDQSASRTLGGGQVLDPFPPARRGPSRDAALDALAAGNVRATLAALIEAGQAVELDWLATVYNLSVSDILEQLPATAVTVRTEPPVALSDAASSRLRQKAVESLQRFHAGNRNAIGMDQARLHHEVARTLRADVFTALLKSWATGSGLQLRGPVVSFAGHDSTDNPRDQLVWQRIRGPLLAAEASIPSVRELSALTGVPLQQLRDLLHRKAALGELVKITPERFALPETMAMLARKVEETAGSRPDGLFTAAQYRDVIGTGRGLAIEILECLDKRGATQRRGDNLRILRK